MSGKSGKRAIVLSGGGAKGAYEIGVWKALRKLHVHYDIVTGTSVGALNGAFMVQGNYKDALQMWENMNFNLIFSQKFDAKVLEKHGTFELLKTYAKGILKNGGMDVSRMEETMDRFIYPDKFYNSRVDFGMITVNLSNLKPIFKQKKDIPKEQLKDYLMASATCFPAFKIKKIDGDMYIDGGYYDNLPINLAVDMGADDIIAVDLDAIGVKRKLKKFHKDIPITYICPKNELGNFLIFDKKQALRGIQFGYNDTMKVFNKLDGERYTFKKYHVRYSYLKNHSKLESKIKSLFVDNAAKDGQIGQNYKSKILLKTSVFGKILGVKNGNDWFDIYLLQLEFLASSLGLEETKIYSIHQFQKELKRNFADVPYLEIDELKAYLKKNKIRDTLNIASIIRSIYHLMEKENLSNGKNLELLKNIAIFFPRELYSALYLKETIGKY